MNKIPSLPEEVKIAAKERRLLIFLGAGISCAARLPSWDEVKEALINRYRLLPGALENERDAVRKMPHYKCFGHISLSDKETYRSEIEKGLICKDLTKLALFKKWIDRLRLLKPSSIITTNVDNLIPNCGAFTNDQLRFKDECCPQELPTDKVFCIHGNNNDYVFNFFDIESLYNDPHFKNFLYNVFGSYCVLFLGYSLSEERLLDFARVNNKLRRRNTDLYYHYALLPSNNMTNALELQQYYGIKVISYDNSKNNYENFIPTIESWTIPSPKVKKARGKKGSKAQI